MKDERDQFQWFIKEMERVFKDSNCKKGNLNYLFNKLARKRDELFLILHTQGLALTKNDSFDIIFKCCEVANFAMMIANKYNE